jgi:hypothetical protein
VKDIGFYLALAVAIQSLCCAEVAKFATANPSGGGLSAEDRKALENASGFHEVHSTSDLPLTIVTFYGGKLADPGQKWNATDAITDPTLPGKRLIWAVAGGDYYVVHYERGGIAHTFHLLVARFTKNDRAAKVVWNAIGGPFTNYAAFVDALRSGKLDDRMGHSKFW